MRPSSLGRTLVPSTRHEKGTDVPTQTLVERSTRVLWPKPIPHKRHPRRQATATREQALAEARRREIRLRRSLSLAVRRAEETYEFAVRQLDEFDRYLDGVHRRLRAEGYLSTEGRQHKVPIRG
jgi:hypothetical protein